MNKKVFKWIKRIVITLVILFIAVVTGLMIYSRKPYTALSEMTDQMALIDDSSITIERNRQSIQYRVDNPIKNIIFVPGGLVTSNSYSYIALSLALEGYDVTIIKPLFHLAILSPNQGKRYVNEDLDNVIIGHSLGGVVATMVASQIKDISTVILMGSYPIRDITDKDTLFITAEYDLNMDQEAFNDSLKYVNDDTEFINIDGANHAQFGWYGPQKGDGEATISTLTQQNLVIQYILDFIENQDE